MSLNAFAAERRMQIFQDLRAGRAPGEGNYNEEVLREARAKGQPQMGATRYAPDALTFEYIYPNPTGAPILLDVTLTAPERIVYMPVPSWVVESIWQGEISGSYHFASHAIEMLEAFEAMLEPEANAAVFGTHERVGRG